MTIGVGSFTPPVDPGAGTGGGTHDTGGRRHEGRRAGRRALVRARRLAGERRRRCSRAWPQAGHETLLVELARDGTWRTTARSWRCAPGRGLLGADAVFPVLHGPFGEDGTVQGLLELLDVAYVGSGVLASAACMDKVVFKDLMAQAGLRQVDYRLVLDGDAGRGPRSARVPVLGQAGSARLVGRDRARRRTRPVSRRRVREATLHDSRVIVEASAPGIEVECAVLGETAAPQASEPGEIVLLGDSDWYDHAAKYTPGGMELVVPARISARPASALQALAKEAFRRPAAAGWRAPTSSSTARTCCSTS